MAKSLKARNHISLLLVLLANLFGLYAAAKSNSVLAGGAAALLPKLEEAIPAGLSLVLIGLLNALLDSDTKARLVFWRWRHPLPGSEAFTLHAKQDSRVDLAGLKQRLGALPTGRREQNATWYKLYKSVESEPAITHIHQSFLLARDYASLSFLLIPSLGPTGYLLFPTHTSATLYLAALVAQYVLVRQAAKNIGFRFTTTVLALAAAKPPT